MKCADPLHIGFTSLTFILAVYELNISTLSRIFSFSISVRDINYVDQEPLVINYSLFVKLNHGNANCTVAFNDV